jgi:hypothetical protein
VPVSRGALLMASLCVAVAAAAGCGSSATVTDEEALRTAIDAHLAQDRSASAS